MTARSRKRYDACPTCGVRKQVKSAHCRRCARGLRAAHPAGQPILWCDLCREKMPDDGDTRRCRACRGTTGGLQHGTGISFSVWCVLDGFPLATHARCGGCTVLTGPGHVSQQAGRWCGSCAASMMRQGVMA